MIFEDIHYSDADKCCLFDIAVPDNTENPPLYIYFHGGGLKSGSKTVNNSMAEFLNNKGIAYASVNYRMYPSAKFPDYLTDAAAAVAFLQKSKKYGNFSKFIIGGSSAGGYISMMLYFNKEYLLNANADVSAIKGYIFDAGQPTSHFEYLNSDAKCDSRRVLIDKAAPLYYITDDFSENEPEIAIMYAENDIYNRLEQTLLLYRTMLHFKFPEEKLHLHYYKGERHCSYCSKDFYINDVYNFIENAVK